MEESKGSITIVDDDRSHLEELSAILETEGYKVFTFMDSGKALEHIVSTKPDLILLDMHLEGDKSFTLNLEIHKIKPNWEVPLIYLSPNDDTSIVLKAFDNGAVDYIRRPYRSQEVLARINTHIHLQSLKKEAEQAVLAKSEFLATMSHEIRTPMNGILGIVEVLRSTEVTTRQTQLLDTISYSGDLLLSIINSVLDYSKIEAGQMQLCSKPFPILRPIKRCLEILINKAEGKGLFLRDILPADLNEELWVIGDEMRFRQILLNLLNNAIKFTEHGGVSLLVEMKPDEEQFHFKLSIIDTGIGIKKENQQKIFSYFTQEDSSLTRDYEGTGLGLAICSEITKLMDGEIWLDSEFGIGSTFHLKFSLPIYIKSDNTPESKRAKTVVLMPGLRILLAEDNPVNQIVVQSFFTSKNHTVCTVSDGMEVLEKLKTEKFDLILMDVQMPKMNGLDATRKIRACESDYSSIPIIALTANALNGDKEICLDAGMNYYLAKPFTKQDLFKTIQLLFPIAGASQEFNDINLDQEILNEETLIAIMDGMDKNIFTNMLQVYKSDSRKTMNELNSSLEKEDWDGARKCAHRFAGAAAIIGLQLLFKTAKEIEEAIVTLRYEDACFTNQVMKSRFEQSLHTLHAFLEKL